MTPTLLFLGTWSTVVTIQGCWKVKFRCFKVTSQASNCWISLAFSTSIYKKTTTRHCWHRSNPPTHIQSVKTEKNREKFASVASKCLCTLRYAISLVSVAAIMWMSTQGYIVPVSNECDLQNITLKLNSYRQHLDLNSLLQSEGGGQWSPSWQWWWHHHCCGLLSLTVLTWQVSTTWNRNTTKVTAHAHNKSCLTSSTSGHQLINHLS